MSDAGKSPDDVDDTQSTIVDEETALRNQFKEKFLAHIQEKRMHELSFNTVSCFASLLSIDVKPIVSIVLTSFHAAGTIVFREIQEHYPCS